MKNIQILLVCVFSLCSSQGLKAQYDYIQYIRNVFSRTNELVANTEPWYHRSDTLYKEGILEFRDWEHKGSSMKSQIIRYRGEDKFIVDFYYGRGLIFVFTQDHLKDEFGDPYVRENRYYFQDETLIRWLDENKKQVNSSSLQFSQRGTEILEEEYWASEMMFMLGVGESRKDKNSLLYIGPDHVDGVRAGGDIAHFKNRLRKGSLSTGEGSFDVHYIMKDGDEIGYSLPHNTDPNKLGMIIVTSPKAATIDGLRVGSTFGDIQFYYPGVEAHGSELESRTTVSLGITEFLLDAYFNTFQVDESQIPPETKVTQIMISPLE